MVILSIADVVPTFTVETYLYILIVELIISEAGVMGLCAWNYFFVTKRARL